MTKKGLITSWARTCAFQMYGPNFTWRRGTTLARLDRALCNQGWLDLFPDASVFHQAQINSDHRPILLNVFKSGGTPI